MSRYIIRKEREPFTVADALAMIELARKEVSALCDGKKFRMCIPVEHDDSDVTIADALCVSEQQISTLTQELAEARAALKHQEYLLSLSMKAEQDSHDEVEEVRAALAAREQEPTQEWWSNRCKWYQAKVEALEGVLRQVQTIADEMVSVGHDDFNPVPLAVTYGKQLLSALPDPVKEQKS